MSGPAGAQAAKAAKGPAPAPAPAAQAKPPAWAACLEPGHQALGQRDLPRAVEMFTACAKAHPKEPAVWYWLGTAHFLAHQAAQAEDAFRKCLALAPDHLGAAGMLGKLYSFNRDKLGEAEKLLDQVLKARPDSEDARFDLARVYALTGRYDESFRQFNILFQGEVRFALYHTELGKILHAMGLNKEARQEFNRALAFKPDFTPAKDQLKALDEKAPAAAPESKPAR